MGKHVPFALSAALALACGTVSAAPDAPQSLMAQAYGNYSTRFGCWVVEGGQVPRPHCMKPVSKDRVAVGGKSFTYLLVSGNEIDLKNGNNAGVGAHVSGGLVGMFVYTGPDSNPKVVAKEPLKELGKYGDAPKGRFVKLGPTRYGWQFEDGDLGQGYDNGWLRFFTLEKNGMGQQFIQDLGSIPIYYDNSGAVGPDGYTNYSGKATIVPSQAKDGFYPVSVQMERTVNGKKLAQKTYEVRYSFGKGEYALPDGYPIAEP